MTNQAKAVSLSADSSRITTSYEATLNSIRPYVAYIDGVMLRNSRGVGRRFKTEQAAHDAAAMERSR